MHRVTQIGGMPTGFPTETQFRAPKSKHMLFQKGQLEKCLGWAGWTSVISVCWTVMGDASLQQDYTKRVSGKPDIYSAQKNTLTTFLQRHFTDRGTVLGTARQHPANHRQTQDTST